VEIAKGKPDHGCIEMSIGAIGRASQRLIIAFQRIGVAPQINERRTFVDEALGMPGRERDGPIEIEQRRIRAPELPKRSATIVEGADMLRLDR
jgi:hypothetical protein